MITYYTQQVVDELLAKHGEFELFKSDSKNKTYLDVSSGNVAIVTRFDSSDSIFVTIQDAQGIEVNYED